MIKDFALELLLGYSRGIFPMADQSGNISWYAPNPRAIIPLDQYRPSKSLRPYINQRRFDIMVNKDFKSTIRNCAQPRFKNDETWISDTLIQGYTELHRRGFAHSVEAYQDGTLVGGLYGVSIGKAFFGESMFFRTPNASKVAFHFLIKILKHKNFKLLDSQFINDNVKRYGAIEIPKVEYESLLRKAINPPSKMFEDNQPRPLQEILG